MPNRSPPNFTSSLDVKSTISPTQSEDNEDYVNNTNWEALEQVVTANCDYFSTHQDENGLRIYSAGNVILDILKKIRPLYNEILNIAPQFDFNENTPGNGYRSFLSLVDKCILHTNDICQQIYSYRNSILFRKSHYMREIEACSQLIASLCTFFTHLKTLCKWSKTEDDGKLSLFPSDEHSPQELLNQAENNIDQYCFYGRCLGFQFAGSMKYLLKTILVFMASFSEVYYKNGSLLGRCTNSVKYVVDPEARARRIVNISQRADIHFCKTFWLLNETEIVQFVPFLLVPTLAINQIISIPPEHLTLQTSNGTEITIPIPNSHIGKRPIRVRLLSAKRRIGMVGSARVAGELHGPSDTLLFHCHGGGFVAQSSKCHEIYLRNWAIQLDVPLLSIDYSLAPEAPYPRAVEEILYSYAWALKHADSLLGSTAKKIIFIGDSAGANLNMALTTKCFELNIRKPDGIFMAYVPVLVEFIPSPARMLGLTDPMLPFGFMMRCLKAYTLGDVLLPKSKDTIEQDVSKSDTESFAEVSESDLIALALSPNGDETNENKLTSLPSDSTLNSVSLVDIDPTAQTINNQSISQRYIKKFYNLYKNFTNDKSSPNASVYATTNNECDNSDAVTSASFFGLTFSNKNNDQLRELDTSSAKSPSEEFVFTVPRDPLLSPYRISDDILKSLPPTKIVTTDLDPCLDDCVMFARKLNSLGTNVSLDILSGLPHGFLSFSVASKDAHEGSELCMKRIKELIDM